MLKGQIKGTFKVIREINRGMEGVVYLCQDRSGKKYAAKCYNNTKLGLMNRELYFHRTMMREDRFLHPVDVARMETEETADTYIPNTLVFPYVKGGDGFDFIDYFTEKDGYNTIKAQEFLLEHCMEFWNTLELCHEHNVCHWDIKPINILINNYQSKLDKKQRHNMFLIDFGLSTTRRFIYKKAPSQVYSAPEVYQVGANSSITYKCDVWSAGASWLTLALGHEGLLTHKNGEQVRAKGYKIIGSHAYAEKKLLPGIQKILEATLIPDPKERANACDVYTI